MMTLTREEFDKRLAELKQEKNPRKRDKLLEELAREAGRDLVHWSVLSPILKESWGKIHDVFGVIIDRLKTIEKKQTEFETTFRNIMKRLLVLEKRRDQTRQS